MNSKQGKLGEVVFVKNDKGETFVMQQIFSNELPVSLCVFVLFNFNKNVLMGIYVYVLEAVCSWERIHITTSIGKSLRICSI